MNLEAVTSAIRHAGISLYRRCCVPVGRVGLPEGVSPVDAHAGGGAKSRDRVASPARNARRRHLRF
jgi:hypothetical protein